MVLGPGQPITTRSELGSTTDPSMQQATVNLFADMGVQPVSLQPPLAPAIASTDTTPPTSTITSPAPGANLQPGAPITVKGTAVDAGGGVVAGVEVSIDGGATWHPAVGRASWSYTGNIASSGSVTIRSRAVDDSGNLETPSAGVTVNVALQSCPCTIWPSSATPINPNDPGPDSSVELGVKFQADFDGTITGIRFYKLTANTGTHVGNLWSSSGALLASATFTSESGSGWQEVDFTSPVAITANTVYVASYHTDVGHYALDSQYLHRLALIIRPCMLCRTAFPVATECLATAPAMSSRRAPSIPPTIGSTSCTHPPRR